MIELSALNREAQSNNTASQWSASVCPTAQIHMLWFLVKSVNQRVGCRNRLLSSPPVCSLSGCLRHTNGVEQYSPARSVYSNNIVMAARHGVWWWWWRGGGLSLPATGHTPLLLMVWCECAHESISVCACPWGYTSCGGKWLIQSSPPFYLSTWVHATITALWAGNHLCYGVCNNSLAPFTLC